MTYALILAAFLAGIAAERARSQRRLTAKATAFNELMHECRKPLDLEPCEFTGFWQERR